MRNGLIPIITILALLIPEAVAGAVITEQVFAWNGMGQLAVKAASARDPSLMMAIILITGIAVLIANIIADIGYAVADPRVAIDRANEPEALATAWPRRDLVRLPVALGTQEVAGERVSPRRAAVRRFLALSARDRRVIMLLDHRPDGDLRAAADAVAARLARLLAGARQPPSPGTSWDGRLRP